MRFEIREAGRDVFKVRGGATVIEAFGLGSRGWSVWVDGVEVEGPYSTRGAAEAARRRWAARQAAGVDSRISSLLESES